MAGEFHFQRRVFATAQVGCKPAARGEAAAGDLAVERRHHAGDLGQTLVPMRSCPVHLRHRTEQPDRVGMLRLREQSGDRRLFDLAASIHHHDPIGDLGDHGKVVGDEGDGGAEFATQVQDQPQDLRLDGHVECGRRLVGEQDRRPAGERHRDHHALAHAAGELVRKFVRAAFGLGHAHAPQQLDRARLRVAASQTLVLDRAARRSAFRCA